MSVTPDSRALLWVSLAVSACSPAAPAAAPPEAAEVPPVVAPPTPMPDSAAFDAGNPLSVAGGPALGCEAKAVAEWVRLSCRGLSYTGGLPWRVTVHNDSAGQVLRKQELGHVSLTWRHTPGTDARASFVWYPHIFRFRAHFPDQGQGGAGVGKHPAVLGSFVGAPPAQTADTLIQAVCACPPRLAPARLFKSYACESPSVDPSSAEPWDPACLRHLGSPGGCQNLNECLTNEPSGFKKCAEDELRSGPPPYAGCLKRCDEGAPCPEGFNCEPSVVLTKSGDLGSGETVCSPSDAATAEHLQELEAYLAATGEPTE